MRLVAWIFSTACALAALPALAQTPAVDPQSYRGQQAGPLTQVFTLGNPHLSELPANVQSAMMEPLLDRLAAFKPDIITHEGISGEQCDVLKRYETRYPDMFKDYCRSTDAALAATGLDIPAAIAAVESTLAQWPAEPSAAQRRQLAATFLAAGDEPSAQVQWRRLPPAERRSGDGLNEALVTVLKREGAKPNETVEVGVALAVRLGLDRLYAVDDHTADSIQALAGAGFGDAVQAVWSKIDFPEAKEYGARGEALANGSDMLSFYRFINRPSVQRAFIEGDHIAAMKAQSDQLYGRQYLAWWETRNLRMVANIRAAFGNRPGAKVLNIVGASHKAYYDTYLGLMSDVTLVDAQAVLGSETPMAK